MKQKLKKKMSSYSFWTGLAAAVVILAKSIADIFGATVNEEIITNVIMAICGLLVALGFVTMPTAEQEKEETQIDEEKKDGE